MEGTLKDYYITSGMIAEQWNESGYLTAEGTKWNADKVTKKFRMILNTIDGIIDSSGALENLYRSENGGKEGSHFIFFDAGEIMEHRQKFEVALLSEYGELIEEAPVYFNDYETDTYDSLKCVFDLWDQAGGGGHFMGQEMAVFRKKMENLLPWHRNIDDEKKAVVQSKSEDEGAYEELKALMKQFEEDKQLVRRYMNRLYTATRGGAFYKKRIFVEKYYVKNGQIDCLKEWMDKWMYVIDHAEAIYVEAGQTKLAVRDVVKVLLIWYQNEKREKINLGNELKNELKGEINSILEKNGKRIKETLNKKVGQIIDKYFDGEGIETSSGKEVAKQSTKWVSNLAEYKKSEFMAKAEDDKKSESVAKAEDDKKSESVAKAEDDKKSESAAKAEDDKKSEPVAKAEDEYYFIIMQAFEELEQIYEEVLENIEALENPAQDDETKTIRGQKSKKQRVGDIMPYLLTCMEIINPHIDRQCMVPSVTFAKYPRCKQLCFCTSIEAVKNSVSMGCDLFG